ncbi:MAG TPA: tetratricopeptide repeat protein [Gemmatimonadales bacterium]|nr:tetratricopeptide repeat protein [Gemmatimonadales bacterium]
MAADRRPQQWDLARADRRRAIETNPDDADSLVDLGAALLRAGRGEQAVAAPGASVP